MWHSVQKVVDGLGVGKDSHLEGNRMRGGEMGREHYSQGMRKSAVPHSLHLKVSARDCFPF